MSRAEQCLVSHTLRFLNRSPQIGGSTHLLATFTFTLLLRSQTYPTSVGPEDKAGAELLDSWYDTPVDLSKDEELNAASYLVEEEFAYSNPGSVTQLPNDYLDVQTEQAAYHQHQRTPGQRGAGIPPSRDTPTTTLLLPTNNVSDTLHHPAQDYSRG